MSEQTSIPVAEVVANPEHPLHAEVADVCNKLSTGDVTMCACMGPVCGEPYCPCEMNSRGLGPSPARLAADAEAAQKFAARVQSGVFAQQ